MNSWKETVQVPQVSTKTLMVEMTTGAGAVSHEATIDDVAAWYKAQTLEDQRKIREAIGGAPPAPAPLGFREY
jgi:hypothetical protein